MLVTPACRTLLLMVMILGLALPALAQEAPAPTARYTAERNLVVSALQTVLGVIREVLAEHDSGELGERLRAMRRHLTDATVPLGLAPGPVSTAREDDLRQLERLLLDLYDQLRDLRHELEDSERFALANRLYPIERSLRDALVTVRRLTAPDDASYAAAVDAGTLRSPRHEPAGRTTGRHRPPDRRPPFAHPARWRPDWDTPYAMVGEVWNRWPYPATALYRPIPAIRYNRVEGLVLGIGRGPLDWDSYERSRLYGQVAYAFGLERFRYEAGLEVRLGPRYGNDGFDVKLGGAYRKQTTTDDLWKSSWLENTAAALLFRNDFFDYFETEGWTIYAVTHLTPYLQAGAGFRQESHTQLNRTTSWSLFGGPGFRDNPDIRVGEMNTLALTLEGGRVEDFDDRPRGAGFRLEAEFGDGLGGDFGFNRYTGDLRLYLLPAGHTGLNLRLRGGLATGEVPPQKWFTLGGIGSMRAYPQNAFTGTRALLANAELAFYEDSPLDDLLWDGLYVFGLFDAGWTGAPGQAFALDDVLPAAGFGIGLDDRRLRLELVWPLRDPGTGTDPTLWLRITPAF